MLIFFVWEESDTTFYFPSEGALVRCHAEIRGNLFVLSILIYALFVVD
jgi:hypothetical protein